MPFKSLLGVGTGKKIFLTVGFLIFFALIFLSPFEGLTRSGQNSLAIFVLCVTLWVSNAIPLSVTGLLALAIIPALGVLSPERTFSLFGNRAVFFILGVFIIASGMMDSGLARRIALFMLRKFGSSAKRVIIGVLWTSATLALFMPEHGVAAMLFPVILDIAHYLKLKPRGSKIATLLFLSMAWGSVIGGIGTLLGGARAPLAVGMLQEEFGIRVDFLQWTLFALPISILILIATTFYILIQRVDTKEISYVREEIEKRFRELGGWTGEEKKMFLIFFFTFVGWVFLNKRIDMAVVSILGAVLLFVFRVITWKKVEEYVNWGIILMYGGAIALGNSLVETGAASWLADKFLYPLSPSPFIIMIIVSVIAIILTEGISNVATVASLLPVVFGLSVAKGYDPLFMTLIVAIPAGLSYSLPIGTPPNAIAFSAGYYTIRDSLKHGIFLSSISLIILIIVARVYWPYLGVKF